MSDKIDEIFESMDKAYIDYITGKFICDKCKQKRPLYHSVLLPARASNKLGRVCERCYWEIYDELKGDKQ